MAAAHAQNVVHGDLKPGNIMVTVDDVAKVMDFGMAFPVGQDSAHRVADSQSVAPRLVSAQSSDSLPTITLRSPGPLLRGGTPDYFAPEQIGGEPATTATDVYAFALVIADMLGVPRANRLKPDSERMPARWARILRR